jgi:NAD(P)H dehydrogenase (quinone)
MSAPPIGMTASTPSAPAKTRISQNKSSECVPEAAAITLTTDGHAYKTYDITGPEALTPRDLTALYADVSGKPVKVRQLSDTMLTSVLVGIGTPMPFAISVNAFGRAVRQGYFDVLDPAFERLTGHPPVALRDVLVAHRADLLAVG